jgi:hypothetical protein
VLVVVLGTLALAGSASATEEPALRSRAFEAGLAASSSTVEGNTQALLAVRVGTFLGAPKGLASVQIETTFAHEQSLDELGLEAALGWLPDEGQVLPFVAVAAGVRQEWIGSFREARYPVGFDLGARLLLSPRVGLRGEYRLRRMLDDPVADFTEHRFLVGISVFWNNG